jgi:hypothetical protein
MQQSDVAIVGDILLSLRNGSGYGRESRRRTKLPLERTTRSSSPGHRFFASLGKNRLVQFVYYGRPGPQAIHDFHTDHCQCEGGEKG